MNSKKSNRRDERKTGQSWRKMYKNFSDFLKRTRIKMRLYYRTKEGSRIRPDHVFKEKQGQVNLWRKLTRSRYSDSSTLHSCCSFIQVHKPKNDTYFPMLSVKGDQALIFWKNASPGVVSFICLVYEFYLKTLITRPIFTDSGEILPTFPL